MATRVHRPLKVVAFNANGIERQRYELNKQLQEQRIDVAHLKLSDMNSDLPGLDRLLKHKQRLRKLWHETRDHD
jgi:hypothetical protein